MALKWTVGPVVRGRLIAGSSMERGAVELKKMAMVCSDSRCTMWTLPSWKARASPRGRAHAGGSGAGRA